MKKIILTMAILLTAVCANAQVYVGGSLGLNYEEVNSSDDGVTSYSIIPEIGYKFNSDWTVGVSLGYSHGNHPDESDDIIMGNTFEISPYARYTFLQGKFVNVFCDGGLSYAHTSEIDKNVFSVGLKPGVELKLDKFSLVAHVGFVGWKHTKYDGGGKTNKVGLDVDGSGLSIGLFYNL